MNRFLRLVSVLAVLAAAAPSCKSRAQRPPAPDPGNGRTITINNRALKDRDWATLTELERGHGDKKLPDGAY